MSPCFILRLKILYQSLSVPLVCPIASIGFILVHILFLVLVCHSSPYLYFSRTSLSMVLLTFYSDSSLSVSFEFILVDLLGSCFCVSWVDFDSRVSYWPSSQSHRNITIYLQFIQNIQYHDPLTTPVIHH